MAIKKYRDGDIVKVREDLQMKTDYRMKKTSMDSEVESSKLLKFRGETVTIKTQDDWWCYAIREADSFYDWTDEMFTEVNRKETEGKDGKIKI